MHPTGDLKVFTTDSHFDKPEIFFEGKNLKSGRISCRPDPFLHNIVINGGFIWG